MNVVLFRSANVSTPLTMTLYQFFDTDNDVSTVNLQVHIASAASDNWKILDPNTN